MPLIERYVFRRTAQLFLFILGGLVGVLWITQVLRELDVVTARGQAITTFLLMTFFGLPSLVQVAAPVAFLAAALAALNNLGSSGELPVIPAAGASPKAVIRPVMLLGLLVTLAVAFSHHVLTPASLASFRVLLTQVRADVIASLVQSGGFRQVDKGLTVHFRDKAPDGTFLDIFVDDERDPRETLSFAAAHGMLLQNAGGSYLVLQDGDLIRSDHVDGDSNVVSFETYALDLSQIGAASAAPVYESMERSTLFLLDPSTKDAYALKHRQRTLAEIHDRMTAPLYALAFGLIALAFLGRPHSNREGRGGAIAAALVVCLLLRAGGFAAWGVTRNSSAGVPFMYAVPLAGIAFGLVATMRSARLAMPAPVVAQWDRLRSLSLRIWMSARPQAGWQRSP